MTARDAIRVREIFESCVDILPAEREVLASAYAAGNVAVFERAMRLLETHDDLESEISLPAPPVDQLARAAMYLESVASGPSETVDHSLLQTLREMASDSGMASVASRYQLGDLVAQGGMGEVHDAHDGELDRHVAAKILRGVKVVEPFEELSPGDAWRIRRFLTEVQITAELQHPAIPPVYSRGLTSDGALFFTMPRLDGSDLGELVRVTDATTTAGRNALLRVLCSVGDALVFAHARNVIHRDLKPGNVIVGENGETYVIDWGLARRTGAGDPDDATRPEDAEGRSSDGRLTQTGRALGTLAYMPPEQSGVLSAPADERSDIYSLGATLVHVLAGAAPLVPHGELGATLDEKTHSPELVAIATKATALNPADRYASVQEMVADVRASMDHRIVQAHNTGPWTALRKWSRRNRFATAAIGAFMIAAIAAGGFYVQSLKIEKKKTEDHLASTRRVADCLTAALLELNLQKGDEATFLAADLFYSLQERMDLNLGHLDDLDAYLRWSSINARQLLSIGKYDDAASIARRVIERSAETGRETSDSMAVAREVLANSLLSRRTLEAALEAETVIGASLAAWEKSDRQNLEWRVSCLGQLSAIQQMRGDREGFRSTAEDLMMTLQVVAPGSENEAVLREHLVVDRIKNDEHALALPEARELLEYVLNAEWGGPDHTKALGARSRILSCLVATEKFDAAVAEARSLVDDNIRLHGDGARATSLVRRYLAAALIGQDKGNISEVHKLMTRASEAFIQLDTADFAAAINTLHLLHSFWAQADRTEESHPVTLQALELAREHLDVNHRLYIDSLIAVAASHLARGEFADAERLMNDELKAHQPPGMEQQAYWPSVLLNCAQAADGLGDIERGQSLWKELAACPLTDEATLAIAQTKILP